MKARDRVAAGQERGDQTGGELGLPRAIDTLDDDVDSSRAHPRSSMPPQPITGISLPNASDSDRGPRTGKKPRRMTPRMLGYRVFRLGVLGGNRSEYASDRATQSRAALDDLSIESERTT